MWNIYIHNFASHYTILKLIFHEKIEFLQFLSILMRVYKDGKEGENVRSFIGIFRYHTLEQIKNIYFCYHVFDLHVYKDWTLLLIMLSVAPYLCALLFESERHWIVKDTIDFICFHGIMFFYYDSREGNQLFLCCCHVFMQTTKTIQNYIYIYKPSIACSWGHSYLFVKVFYKNCNPGHWIL